MIQYGGRGGGSIPVVATTVGVTSGVTTLPVTGGNWIVSVAAALGAVLLFWGIAYAVKHRIQ